MTVFEQVMLRIRQHKAGLYPGYAERVRTTPVTRVFLFHETFYELRRSMPKTMAGHLALGPGTLQLDGVNILITTTTERIETFIPVGETELDLDRERQAG